MKFCPSCGAGRDAATQFCVNCGHQFAHGDAAAPTEALPTVDPAMVVGSAPTGVDEAGPPAGAVPVATGWDAASAGLLPAIGEPELSPRWAENRPRVGRRAPLVVLAVTLVVLVAGAAGVHALLQQPTLAAVGAAAGRVSAPVTAAAVPSSPSAASTTKAAAPRPPATLDADAARQITALLDESSQARAIVVSATGGLGACTLAPEQAVSELQGVVDTRRRLLAEVAAAPFGALPGGPAMRGNLTAAWTFSLQADQSYLAWAQDALNSGGCLPSDANVQAAGTANTNATTAKKAFAAAWNARVAVTLHLATRKDTDL